MSTRGESNLRGKKVAVVTGARSDYGLMYWVLNALEDHPGIELQLIVTGMHLSPEFGSTEQFIVADGFEIAARVETLLSSGSGVGTGKSIGLGVIGFADAFARLKPDILLVFGDRFEIFAAAQAAMTGRIPIAHVHGGEVTEGANDEQMRHCISKMSQIHFVAAEPYGQRLVRMGEQPHSVHVVGAPGLDHLARTPLLSRSELAERLGQKLSDDFLVVTYHPATLGDVQPAQAFSELLAALDQFPENSVILTLPNADAGGRHLIEMCKSYASENPGRVILMPSMGQQLYLSALSAAGAVVGNSSSGLLEAPAAGTPSVNIGLRQQGRLRGPAVIDCCEERGEIAHAIRQALGADMQRVAARKNSIFGEPGKISDAIVNVIAKADPASLLRKTFFDGEK